MYVLYYIGFIEDCFLNTGTFGVTELACARSAMCDWLSSRPLVRVCKDSAACCWVISWVLLFTMAVT